MALSPYQLNQVVKTQQIRMMDVWVLGPLMIYAASLIPEKHGLTKAALALGGITTIAFNWYNYRQIRLSQGAKSLEGPVGKG